MPPFLFGRDLFAKETGWTGCAHVGRAGPQRKTKKTKPEGKDNGKEEDADEDGYRWNLSHKAWNKVMTLQRSPPSRS